MEAANNGGAGIAQRLGEVVGLEDEVAGAADGAEEGKQREVEDIEVAEHSGAGRELLAAMRASRDLGKLNRIVVRRRLCFPCFRRCCQRGRGPVFVRYEALRSVYECSMSEGTHRTLIVTHS